MSGLSAPPIPCTPRSTAPPTRANFSAPMAHQKSDGMNYAPEGKAAHVVKKDEFPFAAVALDHGHIYGQCRGLTEAGGELKYVFDPDSAKVDKFCATFPGVEALPSLEAVLEKPEIKLVTAAAVPNERGPLGLRVLDAE